MFQTDTRCTSVGTSHCIWKALAVVSSSPNGHHDCKDVTKDLPHLLAESVESFDTEVVFSEYPSNHIRN